MTTLEILERAVEAATGEPIEVLRYRSLEESRRLAELRHGAPMRFESSGSRLLSRDAIGRELLMALESSP